MLDRTAWDNVGDVVVADHFFRPDHAAHFREHRGARGRGPALRSGHGLRAPAAPRQTQRCRRACVSRHADARYAGRRQRARLRRDRQGARAAARAGERRRRDRGLGLERRRRKRARSRGDRPSGAFSPSPKARARGKGYVSARQALPALDRSDRRSVQQPQQAARPAHGLHRFRLQDRRPARRRPADHRGPPVDG